MNVVSLPLTLPGTPILVFSHFLRPSSCSTCSTLADLSFEGVPFSILKLKEVQSDMVLFMNRMVT